MPENKIIEKIRADMEKEIARLKAKGIPEERLQKLRDLGKEAIAQQTEATILYDGIDKIIDTIPQQAKDAVKKAEDAGDLDLDLKKLVTGLAELNIHVLLLRMRCAILEGRPERLEELIKKHVIVTDSD